MQQVLCFQHQNQKFCLNISEVSEVLNDVAVVRLPRSPEAFDGIFQLRGRVITLLSFSRCFQDITQDGTSQVIVFADPHSRFGLRVPGLVEFMWMPVTNLQSPEGEIGMHSVLEGIVLQEEERYHLISATKLFRYARAMMFELVEERGE